MLFRRGGNQYIALPLDKVLAAGTKANFLWLRVMYINRGNLASFTNPLKWHVAKASLVLLNE